MNHQWLTILKSKLNQTFQKNVVEKIESELEVHGLKLSPVDLSIYLEQYSPEVSRMALSLAMELNPSFSAGMGIIVKEMSDEKIEIEMKSRQRNFNEQGRIHEGALVTAAMETVKLFWQRHAPLGEFNIYYSHSNLTVTQMTSETIRMMVELSEKNRENILTSLRQHSVAELEQDVLIFGEQNQMIADVKLTTCLQFIPTLTAKN